jgi:hypothetical protein
MWGFQKSLTSPWYHLRYVQCDLHLVLFLFHFAALVVFRLLQTKSSKSRYNQTLLEGR